MGPGAERPGTRGACPGGTPTAGRDEEAVPWLRRAADEAVAIGAHADALSVHDNFIAECGSGIELQAGALLFSDRRERGTAGGCRSPSP